MTAAASVSSTTAGAAAAVSSASVARHVSNVAPPRFKGRGVEVAVTILSVSGVSFRDTKRGAKQNKKKTRVGLLSPKRFRTPPPAQLGEEQGTAADATTVVASFSRTVTSEEGKAKTILTHVPSLPVPLSDATTTKKDCTSDASISWPEQQQQQQQHAGIGRQRLASSYQLQCRFPPPQDTSASRTDEQPFEPLSVPIQIAVSRAGRMFKLGTAHLRLAGDETGETSVDVPIHNCNPEALPQPKKSSKFRKNSRLEVPMMKLNGETLACGLAPTAALRALVHVRRTGATHGETFQISKSLTATTISNGTSDTAKARREEGTQRTEQRQAFSRKKQQEQEQETAAGWLHPVQERRRREPATAGDTGSPLLPSWLGSAVSSRAAVSRASSGLLARILALPDEEDVETVHCEGDDHEDDETREGDDHAGLDTEEDLGTHDCEEEGTHFGEKPTHDEEDRTHYEDEPSCTSSAYMLDACPTKRPAGSYGTTATTGTAPSSGEDDSFSVFSDLTGVEVVPLAPAGSVPPNSRLRYDDEEEAKRRRGASGRAAGDGKRASGAVPRGGRGASPRTPTRTWRQRLACGLPACGPRDWCRAGDDDAVWPPARHAEAATRGAEARRLAARREPLEIEHGVSYWTEEDGASFLWDEDDDETDDTWSLFEPV